MLHFFKYPSKLLLKYDSQHTSPIVAIDFGKKDDQLLITAAEDGSIHFHNISLPRAVRAGRGAGDGPSLAAQAAPLQVAFSHKLAVGPADARNQLINFA